MSSHVNCPHCQARLRNQPAMAGKQVTCPKCKKPFVLPPAAAKPPEVATAASVVDDTQHQAAKKWIPLVLTVLLACLGSLILMCGCTAVLIDTNDESKNIADGNIPAAQVEQASADTGIERNQLKGTVTLADGRSVTIVHGMYKGEVKQILGPPDRSGDLQNGWEAWIYDNPDVELMFSGSGRCGAMDVDGKTVFSSLAFDDRKDTSVSSSSATANESSPHPLTLFATGIAILAEIDANEHVFKQFGEKQGIVRPVPREHYGLYEWLLQRKDLIQQQLVQDEQLQKQGLLQEIPSGPTTALINDFHSATISLLKTLKTKYPKSYRSSWDTYLR